MAITGLVITKNEADNIAGCLKSLSWCDELVVVDSFSNDATVEVAQQRGARIIQHEFHDYGSQKQFAIQQAKHEWILMIDADERVTPELRDEICKRLQLHDDDEIGGYKIPMLDLMFGKYIYHGGWGRYYRTSLFRKDRVSIHGGVHEKITASGIEKKLNNHLLHFSHFTIDHFLFKLNKYTSIEAKAAYAAGKRTNIINLLVLPVIVFCYKYFWKRGFLDGLHGYTLAVMLSMYHLVRHAKLLMLEYQTKHADQVKKITDEYEVYPRKFPEFP
jgi:glycosyltransferase involved in cell wall biosynthesis